MTQIYLDFNSTAPVLPEVAAAMAQAEAMRYANPASQHAAGRAAHRVLEEIREEIARQLGADLTDRSPDRLIFTSGGTEANNLALISLAVPTPDSRPPTPDSRIVISAIEHPSITAAADHLAMLGWQIERLEVTQDGVVRLDQLDALLRDEPAPRLVSVMLTNNETGIIQPVAEIARRCSAAGVPLHTDAVQAVGKIPVNFRDLGVTAMTLAAHKLGGPRGIGALVVRHGTSMHPVLHGATQQLGLRPGTESIVLPIGFLAALRAWRRDGQQWSAKMAALRDRFESGIREAAGRTVVNGAAARRLPNTSNIAFIGHDRQALFMALDLAGICCSTGSACASGSSEPSPTLLAMNLPRGVVDSSLRFSLGPTTSEEEVDDAIRTVREVYKSQRPSKINRG
jgi:cysteine desulfurase